MEFRVLGPVEVVLDDAVVRIGSPTQRTLLALLLMHPDYGRELRALLGEGAATMVP